MAEAAARAPQRRSDASYPRFRGFFTFGGSEAA